MRGEQFAADHHSWMGSNLQSCAKMLDRSWKNDGFLIVNKKKSKANKIKLPCVHTNLNWDTIWPYSPVAMCPRVPRL
jgi:lipopolysaccharide biosynthesis glycosyltransferase